MATKARGQREAGDSGPVGHPGTRERRAHLGFRPGAHGSGSVLVRPLAALAVAWAAACGGDGDGGGTAPEPPPQPNRAPVASGSIPAQNMETGASATVSVASVFSDPDGDALTHTAISSNPGVAGVALSGTNLTITAVAAGTATVTVTARDPAGLSAAASANVTVVDPNRPPAAAVPQAPPQTIALGDTLRVNVAPFFSDPDGDPLAYSAASADTTVVTASMEGSVGVGAAVGVGSTTLMVTATDPGGLSASITVPVTVFQPNRAPVAMGTVPPLTAEVGDTLPPVDASVFFSDPDGDDLAYSAAASPAGIVTLEVAGATVTAVAVGAGSATLTLTATDPDGLSASLDASVTVTRRANRPPEATSSSLPPLTVTAGQSATVDVSSHFTDPDGDMLAFAAETSDAAVATVPGTGATVTVMGVAAGTTTLTVTASDPGGLTATLSGTVTVAPPPNRPPEARSTIAPINLTVGRSGTLDLEGANPLFTDPDGDRLTYTAVTAAPAVATVSVTGSLLRVVAVALGTTTMTVTATDPGGLSASVTADVTVVQASNAIFRDDFDGTSLSSSNWQIVGATALVSDGILRLTNSATGSWGYVAHALSRPITSWEVRARLGRARADSMQTAIVLIPADAGDLDVRAFRLEVGSRTIRFNDGTQETINYGFSVLFQPEGRDLQWYYISGAPGSGVQLRGRSDAVNDGVNEFTEIAISVKDGTFQVRAGSEALFSTSQAGWTFSSSLLDITQVHLWTHDPDAAHPGLFDWVEVNGVPKSGSSANADGWKPWRSGDPAGLHPILRRQPAIAEEICFEPNCR